MTARTAYIPVSTRDEGEKQIESQSSPEYFPYHEPQSTKKKVQLWSLVKNSITVLGLLSGACSLYHWRYYASSNTSIIDDSLLVGDKDGNTIPPQFCSPASSLDVKAPKTNIWKNLDVPTASSVREWLFADERGLNLTKNAMAKPGDNTIFLVESWRPKKKDALAYIGGDADAPTQYARAIISHATNDPPVIRDYLIGPLPVSEETTMRQMKEIYTNPDIPYNARIFNFAEISTMGKFVQSILSPLGEITMDLFGARADGYANDTLLTGGQAPMSFDGSWRRFWVPLKLKVPGFYLHTLDMQFYVDMTDLNANNWKVLKVWYNSQLLEGIDEFVAAWENGTLKKSEKPELKNTEWSTRVRKGTPRDLDHKAGPRSVSFDGPRFRVDEQERYLTWMGWSFYMGFERDMGLNFWNINFRGERIIYELTAQEAMAQYSGLDPSQSSTVWLDRAFGMGALARSMMVGYDCPPDARYLSSTTHSALGSVTVPNTICIFERDKGIPLSRHWGSGLNEMGATKGYELVVRSIVTVGNYDYLFDYTYQLDGTLEIRFSASGYVQGGFWDGNPERATVGQRIRETSMGALHDHIINYKVDMDIAGTANSVATVSLEVEKQHRPWFEGSGWSVDDYSTRIVKKILKTEDEGKIEYGTNGGKMVVITNEDAKNAWGVPRGYAVHAGVSNIHLQNIYSERTLHNLEWLKSSLHVTRTKDTEPYSSNMFNINLPGKPPLDFSTFLDGESLEQEDLVLWLNLGTHHHIRAEDSPHTLTNVATSYLLLTPYNYNDYDVSMEAQNAVIVNPGAMGTPWPTSGHIQESFCIPKSVPPFQYTGEMELHAELASESLTQQLYDMRIETEQIHGIRAEL